MRPALLLVSAFLAAAPAAAATPTLDESLSLMSVRNPQSSPDGRFVAYERQETDWKENAYPAQIFVVEVASGRAVQLTRGKKASSGAQWSPRRPLDRVPDRAGPGPGPRARSQARPAPDMADLAR